MILILKGSQKCVKYLRRNAAKIFLIFLIFLKLG